MPVFGLTPTLPPLPPPTLPPLPPLSPRASPRLPAASLPRSLSNSSLPEISQSKSSLLPELSQSSTTPRSASNPSFPTLTLFSSRSRSASLPALSQLASSDFALGLAGLREHSAAQPTQRRKPLDLPVFCDNHQLYRFCARHTHRLQIVGDPMTVSSRRRTQRSEARHSARAQMLSGGRSLLVFSVTNPARVLCMRVVTNPRFESLIGVLIVVSSVSLALTPPQTQAETADGSSSRQLVLWRLDDALTLCFLLELTMKVIAEGLVVYLSVGWNCLDCLIVSASVASYSIADANLSYLKALRALRALRPLRMIQRYPAMKTVVDALMEAVPDVMNVSLVVVAFFILFAVAGGTLFRGLLSWCHVSLKTDCDFDYGAVTHADLIYARSWARYTLDRGECAALGHSTCVDGLSWSQLPAQALSSSRVLNATSLDAVFKHDVPNFDNIGNGMLALFEIATLEGWPALMYTAMDTTAQPHAHPRRNASAANALFYVIFVTIGSFFVMNIFVGVVVHKFQVAKERTAGAAIFLTEPQRAFVNRVKVLLDTGRPKRLGVPEQRWQQRIFYFVVSERFEVFIVGAILLNMVAIACTHYDQSANWDLIDFVCNACFTAVFAGEMVLKLVGLGRQYWGDNWNRFDAFIVGISIVDLLSTAVSVTIPILASVNLSLFRILRLARVVKLINVNDGLKTLLRSLIVALPSLMNVFSLLVMMIFVYACVGMNLYNTVQDGDYVTPYCNFRTFGYSMLTLFRCLTGEDWNKIMQEIVDDDHHISAYAFFSTFMLLGNFMMLNLCVAVILEAFAEFMHADTEAERHHRELRDSVRTFKEVWMQHDLENSMFVPAYYIVSLLKKLPAPMGFPDEVDEVAPTSYSSSRVCLSFPFKTHQVLPPFLKTKLSRDQRGLLSLSSLSLGVFSRKRSSFRSSLLRAHAAGLGLGPRFRTRARRSRRPSPPRSRRPRTTWRPAGASSSPRASDS